MRRNAEQWETSKARAVARGVAIGPTPIGYVKPGKSLPYEVDPLYGPAITELFDRASDATVGYTDLARWMDGRAPRADGVPYKGNEVRFWLGNRVYLGEVRYGSLVNPAAHPPLTDELTWERCQRKPGEQPRADTPFLLRGLIRCANCRYSMSGHTHGGAKGSTRIYRCSGGRVCDSGSVITASKIEAYVVDLAGERIEGSRQEPDELLVLETLLARQRAAEDELASFASDLEARRMLGEAGWAEALKLRAEARDRARIAVDRHRVGADLGRSAAPGASGEPEQEVAVSMRDLLHRLVRQIFVRRGRGPTASRALVVWADDELFEVPRPHHGGRFGPIEW